MLVTMTLLVPFKDDAIDFMTDILCHWSYKFPVMLIGIRKKTI